MELKQRDMLREIYRSNLILHGCKTYNLYTTWLVPRDSKVKRILSSDWLPSEKGPVLSAGNFPLNLVPSTLVPKVFLEIFLRERESEQRSGDNESRTDDATKFVKSPLPVDVRRSKTPLLHPLSPYIHIPILQTDLYASL